MLTDENLSFVSNTLTFWDKLNATEKNLIQNNIELVKYSQGHNLHSDKDCIGALMVKKGELRVYMLSDDGRDITLYRLLSGDVCMLSASCILKNITFEVHIDVESESEVFHINSIAYQQLMNSNIYVENFTNKIAVERFSDVMWAMEQILFMSFDKRLAIFLLDEMSKKNSENILLTHEQIAKYIGSAREVVSRMLKHFSEEGIVELSRGGVKIIDKQKLKALTIDR